MDWIFLQATEPEKIRIESFKSLLKKTQKEFKFYNLKNLEKIDLFAS